MLTVFMSTVRRTQAERRAATRSRVLAATVDCLVNHGYANTSTRDIAARAGVTIGALQHHFASKTDLMAAALVTLTDQMADEFMREAHVVDDTPSERIGQLLERVWQVHRGPLFVAGLELTVAARTDAALRAALNDVAQSQSLRILEGSIGAFPDLAATPGFAEAVLIGLATLRGLAMPDLVSGIDPDALWTIAKKQLLKTFDDFLLANPASAMPQAKAGT
jgi:AcrR family transcriptional regulator